MDAILLVFLVSLVLGAMSLLFAVGGLPALLLGVGLITFMFLMPGGPQDPPPWRGKYG